MTEQQSEPLSPLEDLLSACPIIGVYGKTGTGKTTFGASLMGDPRYRKVLYLDADRSSLTVQAYVRQESLCDYRAPDVTSALALQQWLVRQIAGAHKVPGIQAVIIEGLARLYEDLVGEAYAQASPEDLVGDKLMRLYIAPAGLVKATITAACNMQSQFIKSGRHVPTIITSTTKEKSEGFKKGWDVPALSDSATGLLQARSDAFLQMERSGKTTVLRTDRDNNTSMRKLRGATAAQAVAALKNPTAPQMLQVWADCLAAEGAAVHEYLQSQNTQESTESS